jgi:hypothetical protein
MAWGLQQNDLRLPRVPRCSILIIIPYTEPKAKTLGYPRVKAQKIFFGHRFGQLYGSPCVGILKYGLTQKL